MQRIVADSQAPERISPAGQIFPSTG